MKKKWVWPVILAVVAIIIAALWLLPKGPMAPSAGGPEETTLPAQTEEGPQREETGTGEKTDTVEGTAAGDNTGTGDKTTTSAQSATEENTMPSLPQELPPVVELPVETDPVTGENEGITFPATVEGYQLEIEKLAAYDGMFVEDGSNVQVQGVAMLLLKNNGEFPIEYTEITVEYESATLVFAVTALPVGARLVVQEKNGQAVPEGKALSCRALVVQRAELSLSDAVEITENGDDTFTVTNLTKETIPTVRVFYKYYMEEQGIYVGGIAFTVRLTRLGGGSSMTVQPAHYATDTCKVVMVVDYREADA